MRFCCESTTIQRRAAKIALLREFQVLRMILVLILRLFALKLDVQSHLVRLINNVAMTAGHLSDVEIHNTRY